MVRTESSTSFGPTTCGYLHRQRLHPFIKGLGIKAVGSSSPPRSLLLSNTTKGSKPNDDKIGPNFLTWLQSQGKTKSTIKETINYTKRFVSVLDIGDASPLLTLSPRNKQHEHEQRCQRSNETRKIGFG